MENQMELRKTVVFDAYGTLIDIQAIDQALAQAFGPKGGEIGILWRQKQLEYSWLRTLMWRYASFEKITWDALRYASEHTGASWDDELGKNLLQKYNQLEVFPEVPEILGSLKEQHRLAVLSNATEEMLQAVFQKNGIQRDLDFVLSADAIQQFKPAPPVYELAVRTMGVSKEEITFVSSNPWDATGAKSFGFHVIWVNRKNLPLEQMGQRPDSIISDLSELKNGFTE